MHITVQHVAPASELTTSELAQMVSLVRDYSADIAPFAVTAARAEAWEHAIVCPIRPGYLLTTLWQITTSATRQVTGRRFQIRPAVYLPHLSLAYATSHVDQDPIRAWLADSDVPVLRLAAAVTEAGCKRIIYTDIATDGMLSGPNLPALRSLIAGVTVPVIASGGVANETHLRELAETGAEAAIAGKALYSGALPLRAITDWN